MLEANKIDGNKSNRTYTVRGRLVGWVRVLLKILKTCLHSTSYQVLNTKMSKY
jgi:hypothetical protein